MKHKRRVGFFLTGAFLILALCAAVVGLAVWRSSTRGPQILVQIQEPQTAGLANLHEPLPLIVVADADAPIARLEVYADGVLVAARNGEGQNALTLAQTWAPATAGRHVLTARAFIDAEHFADSQVVFVDALDLSAVPIQVKVDDLPRGEGVTEVTVPDLAAAAGTTPDELVRLNPGLSPTGSIPSGSTVSIPRRAPMPASAPPVPPPAPGAPGSPASPPTVPPPAPGAPGSPGSPAVPPPAPGAPGSPGSPAVPPPAPGAPGSPAPSASDPHFDGETHSCSQIAMRWTDAPDETSYSLYRLAPGEDLMSLLVTLPANTTSYQDTPVTRIGTYRYFLAPLRPGGEGITSMLAVTIGADCSPSGSAGASPDLRLSLISLTTQDSYDGVYCYVSVNGSRYERLPAGEGLLRPTSDDLYDLPLQLPNRGQYSLAPAADGLVRLEGECWGRRGAQSVRIGRFAGSHASREWDGRDLISELAFEPQEVASLNSVPLAGGGGATFLRYRISPATSIPSLADLLYNGVLQIPADMLEPIRPERPTVPPPTNVRIVNRFIGMCDPLPSDDPNVGTIVCEEIFSPTLAWDWSPTAEVPQTAVTGFRIVTSIQDTLSPTPAGEGFVNNVSPGTARTAPVPNYSRRWRCGAIVRFTVVAVTDLGNSAPSAAYEVRTPPCPPSFSVWISVDSITIAPSARTGRVLDNGDICIFCDDRRVELSGLITVDDLPLMMTWDESAAVDFRAPVFGDCPNFATCYEAGTFSVFNWTMLPMFERRTYPLDHRPLVFRAEINDLDIWDSPDPFCVATASIAERSLEEWSRTPETVILESDFGEAKCRIQITVRGSEYGR